VVRARAEEERVAWLIVIVWIVAIAVWMGLFVGVVVLMVLRIRGALARRAAAAEVRPYAAAPALPAHRWRETTLAPADVDRLTHFLYPSHHPYAAEPTGDTVDAAHSTTLNGIEFTVMRHTRRWDNDFVQSLGCVDATFPRHSFSRIRVCARHGQGTTGELAAGDEVVQFESDAFNHAYRVSAEDPRNAYEVISASMLEWLLAAPTLVVAVFDGAEVFVAVDVAGSEERSDVGEAELAYFVGMLDRIPERVWSE
jgi:hypothetical protein